MFAAIDSKDLHNVTGGSAEFRCARDMALYGTIGGTISSALRLGKGPGAFGGALGIYLISPDCDKAVRD